MCEQLARPFAGHPPDGAFEFAHTRFPRVAADDAGKPGVVEGESVLLQPGVVALARNEVAPRDFQLLEFAVAGELQHLHAIQQRARDAFQRVGGGDEERFGEIERQIQVVVAELLVLRWVQNLHQRRGRIAPEVSPELVDFVQHQHGIAHPGAAHRLQDAAGHGADVGAAVATQLRFIVQAAQAHALELAAHGTGDGLAQGGLADAGGADEAEDGCLRIRVQLQHSQRFQDALLHVAQAVVVFVEHLLRMVQVQRVFRDHVPRQLGHQLQITAGHLIVRGVGRHAPQALEFPLDVLLHRFRQHSLAQLLLHFGQVFVAVFLAQGLFDGALLLAQQLLPLVLVDVLAALVRDFLAQLHHGCLMRQLLQH